MQDSPHRADHLEIKPNKTGVLLINLGTPDSPHPKHIRRFLASFLNDRRVIEAPRIIWWPILYGIILTLRPRRIAKAYARIFVNGASPLRTISHDQANALQATLGDDYLVRDAATYGAPDMARQIDALCANGCRHIIALGLYPQYSATTSAAGYDKVFNHLRRLRWQPQISTIQSYHDHHVYIDALARSVQTDLQTLAWKPDVIVASYHGLPYENLLKGDPYHCHCMKTSRLLGEALGERTPPIVTAFQSRFGPKQWLQPYISELIGELVAQGKKNICIITPGFAADCLETIDEIGNELREEFLHHGGENFHRIACLNASPDHIEMMAKIVQDRQ